MYYIDALQPIRWTIRRCPSFVDLQSEIEMLQLTTWWIQIVSSIFATIPNCVLKQKVNNNTFLKRIVCDHPVVILWVECQNKIKGTTISYTNYDYDLPYCF